jgi:hypothetical protein
MFTEILKVKPVLDTGSAKQMEASLSARFARVAQRFGTGLKHVIKGSILGISLGLLNKLLNPLEALEEKIKTLLGQGGDIRDLADRFGTTPGQLKRLQDVAGSLGVKPDELKDLLTKFADAVENARKELQDPFQERSAATRAVQNFVGEKDLAEGFLKFLGGLQATGKGPGRDLVFGEREQRRALERELTGQTLSDEERQKLISQGLLKTQSGLETRQAVEKEIFGQALFGGSKRLLEANFAEQAAKINEPSADELGRGVSKLAALEDQRNALEVQRQTKDLLTASSKITSDFVAAMEKSVALTEERETAQLDSFKDLEKARIALEQLKGGFQDVLILINKGVGYLGEVSNFILGVKGSPIFRGIFKSKGGDN